MDFYLYASLGAMFGAYGWSVSRQNMNPSSVPIWMTAKANLFTALGTTTSLVMLLSLGVSWYNFGFTSFLQSLGASGLGALIAGFLPHSFRFMLAALSAPLGIIILAVLW